jgi:hypothetical protein
MMTAFSATPLFLCFAVLSTATCGFLIRRSSWDRILNQALATHAKFQEQLRAASEQLQRGKRSYEMASYARYRASSGRTDVLKLRSDQTDSVSVDLHQQRLNGDGRLLSFGHTCGRLRRRKIKSRHSRILRHRRQSANSSRSRPPKFTLAMTGVKLRADTTRRRDRREEIHNAALRDC